MDEVPIEMVMAEVLRDLVHLKNYDSIQENEELKERADKLMNRAVKLSDYINYLKDQGRDISEVSIKYEK